MGLLPCFIHQGTFAFDDAVHVKDELNHPSTAKDRISIYRRKSMLDIQHANLKDGTNGTELRNTKCE
jgi:hypothetical protein